MATDSFQDQLQRALGNAYRVEREIGAGGMSTVFAAVETSLSRHVAIKVLKPELVAEISSERFAREVRLAASLQQANIVPLISAGTAGGFSYYTMPLVDGSSLRARLASGMPVPLAEAYFDTEGRRAGARVRAQLRHRASRHQAGQHPPVRRDRGGVGLRDRARHGRGARRNQRGTDDHAGRRVDRHARIHGTGTGRG